MDAGDLEILIGLFLCEFGAHLQRKGVMDVCQVLRQKMRQRVIKNSPFLTTKVSRITEMSDRYQGLRGLGTKNRMVEKDLEVLVDYTQQCDYRSHSVNRIIHKSRMLGRMGTG